ncbi:Uncharacterized protein YPO0396 [Desulfuromusa kysingii]|uniref:Uncharacterized protein YPO0396 n=1 Tax=Desulfuromusa kysingii TaxID=37625 RepID=A0A1H3Z1N0_9BACT|nr:ATP-binding protein [Desulfuromusa kysingii]SEA17222.1 Uncharacterized protein YPO0396 [Desulfuromusa kysingii]
MQQQLLDVQGVDDGFRLERAEVFNWGTFNGRVWTIVANGETTLMTGDVGSGKSSAGDALQTLLVPPRRVAYNKAADEAARERTVASYVRGQYSNNIDEKTKKAKPVFLRGTNTYTTILAVFRNRNLKEVVTLVQVLWVRNEGEPPQRLYVVSEKDLGIESHFTGVETIAELKRRLDSDSAIHLHDSFEKYSKHFCRQMGIPGVQALSLFCHTMSMKQVPNLTTFIRDFMLDVGNTPTVVDEVIEGFDSLSEAYESVAKAQKKIELLQPVDQEAIKFQEYLQTVVYRAKLLGAVRPYYASLNIELIEKRIEVLESENTRSRVKLSGLLAESAHLKEKAEEIRNSIVDAGGGRITAIESELERLILSKQQKIDAYAEFSKNCGSLGMVPPETETDFREVRTNSTKIIADFDQLKRKAEECRIDLRVKQEKLRDEKITGIDRELDSLRKRRSNIPLKSLAIRQGIANAVGADVERLPFVGELLEVKEEESAWEGAVERILHNFALSILVPEDLYREACLYIDKTHLAGRVVFYKIPRVHVTASSRLVEKSLTNKINIKSGAEFKGWLDGHLGKRFDIACCDSIEEFRNQQDAVMKSGLSKTRGDRHEKDDRRHIDDRSTYVLGWNNQKKIDALAQELSRAKVELAKISDEIRKVEVEEDNYREKRSVAGKIADYDSFERLDWKGDVKRIDDLTEEKRRIEESSDRLRQLREELDSTNRLLDKNEGVRGGLRDEVVGNEKTIQMRREETLPEMHELLSAIDEAGRSELFTQLAKEIERWEESRKQITINTATKIAGEIWKRMDDYRRAAERSADDSKGRLLKSIGKYRDSFPVEGQEIDIDVRSVPELCRILHSLVTEDLPKHQERFRELLREHTIQGLVSLEESLGREKKNIEDRLSQINWSLRKIDYVKGTYIEIAPKLVSDPEIRQFQADLKTCFSNILDERTLYTEEKFLQVKQIVERLKNRGGDFTSIDKEWRNKVTDVRQWFDFMAHEKFRETNEVKCVYEGSSGRSGGQKEKLAYTILASALAYQFGAEKARSFRFVIVDEAFGRGSEESARFGMELFEMLNLQLLVLTPLQKINVIEKYISSVNFVHNNAEGSCSVLRNMTIEELNQERLDQNTMRNVS